MTAKAVVAAAPCGTAASSSVSGISRRRRLVGVVAVALAGAPGAAIDHGHARCSSSTWSSRTLLAVPFTSKSTCTQTAAQLARARDKSIPQLQVLALLKLHVVRVHALGQGVHVQVRLHAGEWEPLFQAMT